MNNYMPSRFRELPTGKSIMLDFSFGYIIAMCRAKIHKEGNDTFSIDRELYQRYDLIYGSEQWYIKLCNIGSLGKVMKQTSDGFVVYGHLGGTLWQSKLFWQI